ncbi:anaerobic glycerol-3-phosphate dehydrogenase subunit GlpC [Aeromonas hydrophila]|uniref:anaerobic glycerol-3-phosphate dehydrogenase subunit GlpC n=1 Tax=Aeromonas hydrophila TaxID=644 RepID=UPI000C78C2C2|nr:anaerobic glycerol-3-phosphate dehydrogenase subunit GlpC [Aeromonas hydrophila]AWA06818.1 anaerobic glycerol-3-phosphate dehydrogenase subunit C [Aeromonas hydrophila subsp. hydrophila]
MLLDHANQTFDQCIKCTVCTAYCPVAKANPAYPGPKQAGPDGERLRIKSPELFDSALKYCTNCKRCEVACPSGVRIGDIIAKAKHQYSGFKPGIREFVLSHTDLMGSMSTLMAPVVNFTTGLKPMKLVLDKALGVSSHRDLPKYSQGTFRGWYKKQKANQARFERQIAYFHGCYVNYNHPQLGKELVQVLNAMNIGVQLLEREKCCGVPLIANGFMDKAKQQAAFNIKQLENTLLGNEMPLLATSSTCGFTLRDEYPHLLEQDNHKVRDRISLVTRFLWNEFYKGNKPAMKPLNLHIAYHTPCHMEKMGGVIYTLELLRAIPGVKVTVLDSQCCGIAGTYGFKSENYQTSQAIGEGLFDQINRLKPDLVITDCETCKWQIEMSTPFPCEHPIHLLAKALA